MRAHLPEADHDHADLAACRAMLRGGSRTFFAASNVLPRRVSEPAIALYAFCRAADDAVDLQSGKIAALARLRERLDHAYRGEAVILLRRTVPLPTLSFVSPFLARFPRRCWRGWLGTPKAAVMRISRP